MLKKFAYGASVAVLMMTAATAVHAQETTGAIRGTILNDNGAPVANATVTVTHVPSGTRSVAVTGANGQYNARGLRVGGPYIVSADSAGLSGTRDVASIGIGDASVADVYISDGSTQLDELVVVGTAGGIVQTAIGPNAVFTAEDLARAPSINRDIRDVIAIDPRVYVDEAFVDAVQCGGANPRFNSLTVDGVRLNDNFGLNSSGYPTERMPFSYDAVQQVAVELAPFDVEYGNFTACNINAVTKSGGNTLSGGFFYDYSDHELTGASLEGRSVDLGEFEETRWGVNVGGAIIPDRLFFFAAYEKLDGVNFFDRSPAGAGGAEVQGFSQAQYNEILDIARNVYGFDPGGIPAPQPNEDEKLLIKLDWNISDQHRAAFTYNYNDGFNITESDGDSDEFEFSGHLYERGAELNAYVLQVFSDWTDNFSTEFRIAYSTLDARSIPQGGLDVGEIQITTNFDHDNDGNDSRATVYLGADDSRHANSLSYETMSYKAAGAYTMGDHLFTFGYEREELDVFNLFVQHVQGEFRFNSINDFRNGNASRVYYGNAASLDPNDAAASFSYATNTAYAQDEWAFSDDLTLTFGLRYDWYGADDAPIRNANFAARNGFDNTSTLDGKSLLQPRFGFRYDFSDNLQFRGGAGLYSGGNPNVWLSNNYSNDGITNIQVNRRNINVFTGTTGQPLIDIPDVLVADVTAGSPNVGVNALDPDFELPSQWKFAIGATYWFDAPVLGQGVRLDLDLLRSETKDAAIIKDLTLEQIGTMADGRPIYKSIDRSDPDCATAPASAACSNRNFNNDFLLTNTSGGSQTVASASLTQSYDWGLDWTLGYAYTQADDVNPMTSSVAFSNYANVAVFDPNNPDTAKSNYEIPHRITLQVNYEREIFGDYMTRFTLFGRANEGRPYSFVFASDDGDVFGDSIDFRHLLYIPTGPSDPNVVFQPGFDQAAFFDFIDANGLGEFAGSTMPRNAVQSGWWSKFDLRIEQELPGLMEGHRTAAFVVVENLGNLLNDEWGILREASFPLAQGVVDVDRNAAGQYVFQEYLQPAGQSRVTDASLWEVRIGLRYSF
jgi:hypothetical protein